MIDNRREERRAAIRPVYFSGIVTGGYTALTLDTSRCGLCVLTDLAVSLGQNVTLVSKALWKEPVKAEVVWKSNGLSDGYKVGLKLC